MALEFEKHAAKGNEMVNRLAVHLDTNDRDKAARILRSVLRALRKHLTFQESIQLIAQLPMAIKAVYMDGWKYKQDVEHIRTIEELADDVILESGNSAYTDFVEEEDAILAIEAVVKTLASYVSEGEMEDIIGILPKAIGQQMQEWLQKEGAE